MSLFNFILEIGESPETDEPFNSNLDIGETSETDEPSQF